LEEKMKRPPAVDYYKGLYKELKDEKEALLYLNASVVVASQEDEPELILLALYNVAQAQGIQKTARLAGLHRVSLHRMLSKRGNPEWRSLFKVISALKLNIKFEKSIIKAA